MNENAIALNEESVEENTEKLLKAVADGDSALCGSLIQAGAKLNEPGKSVLLRVINGCRFYPEEKEELVRKLVEAGADVHVNDDQALMMAISDSHHWKLVQVLLELGANPNAHNGGLLIQACINAAQEGMPDDLYKLTCLLDAGADVTSQGGKALRVSAKSDKVFGLLFEKLMSSRNADES